MHISVIDVPVRGL